MLIPLLFGAAGRSRTGTVSLPADFESATSANSITAAHETDSFILTPTLQFVKKKFEIKKYFFDYIFHYFSKKFKKYLVFFNFIC